MPWHIEQREGKYCVIKNADNTNEGCSDSREEAVKHMQALYANEPHTSAMLALIPTAEDAARLAHPEFEPQSQLHVTLAFLGKAEDWTPEQKNSMHTAMSEVAFACKKFTSNAFASALFNPGPDQAHCLVMSDGQDGAMNLKGIQLSSQFAINGIESAPCPMQHSPWIPHMTIGYGDMPHEEMTARTGPITFDKIRVSFGNEYTDYAMGGGDMDPTETPMEMPMEMPVEEPIPEPVVDPIPGLAYEVTSVDGEVPWEGDIVFEDQMTGDKRIFRMGSISFGDFPMPFRWAREDMGGHDGAVVIGRVDGVRDTEGGAKRAYGVILTSVPEASEYLDLLEHKAAGGVSIDGDSIEYNVIETQSNNTVQTADGTIETLTDAITEFTALRVRALTAVSIPAFMTGRIHLVNDEAPLLAAGIPVFPPADWFADPDLEGPTPITITPEGRIFGHLATFGTCHIGFPNDCVTPPKGNTYDYFHVGELIAAEGDAIPVGHLTFGTGHADMHASAMAAASHYDNTGTVAADVRAGEDEFGVWVSGAIRSTLSDEQIREFRAAPPSGDWRRIQGRLELVAVLAVNTPGFPVPRARVLVADGSENSTTILFNTNTTNFAVQEVVAVDPEKLAAKNRLAREVFQDTEEYALVASAANLPLASQDRAWDGPGAAKRMLDAASDADGNINKGQASRGFFKVDGDGSKRGDYGLPFADLIGGTLTAVPRGIFAVAGALQGSRGANIEGADAIKSKVAAYYHRLNLKAPWESD